MPIDIAAAAAAADPSGFLRTLGSVASMVSAYIAIRRERRELSDQDRNKILAAGEAAESRQPTEATITVILKISTDILDPYRERLKKAKDRYRKAIKSPIDILDLDQHKDKAVFEVCGALKLIKGHNKGILPEEFESDWDTFDCDEQ